MAYIGNRVIAGVGSAVKVDLDAPTNALRVKNDGSIGIGTANPSTKLHVAGTVTATAFQGDGSALTGIESLPAAIDVDASAPDDSLAINSAGKVGIGTSSPDANGLTISSGGGEMIHLISSHTNKAWLEAEAGNGSMWRLGTLDSNPHVRLEAMAASGEIKFLTGGTNERMRIDSSGDVLPGTNGTQDFGSTSLRWANIYTSDLHLSNGIGNYTIVEGEEDLFLYNNKNGKTYKFVLAEVDPSEAPKKMEK
jgi:hypothetical protein